ncbi:hypothetical protein Tsubulata_004977 [Turnera subulata]|uniref:Ultraviolet-B receptor UVR8 n=1 Tax=Turnera subulata TaxID=218843 RepID=A0A9Q0FRF2_9ROSI|nr:hypothetical protein Tsubulata_004977 [Turnera subulata]
MADRYRLVSMEELPSHLILEILTTGRLSAVDLVCLELTSRTFGGSHELFYPHKFRSLVDFAAYQLCLSHSVHYGMAQNAQKELFDRCGGNWKRVLRFLQAVEESSGIVRTSACSIQVATGRYHTLMIHDSSVYSCGSSLCGVLGHGSETTQCVIFTPIKFPSLAPVVQISASHNHAAFVLQSGEVFTCGDNSSFCCGHRDTSRPIFKPRLVEALKGVPCKKVKAIITFSIVNIEFRRGTRCLTMFFLKGVCVIISYVPQICITSHFCLLLKRPELFQVAVGLNFTVFLTRQGHLYTCGTNTHGQLGHGDTLDRPIPTIIELLKEVGSVRQIAAGPGYVLAVTDDGVVYSFGSGANFCLGHGEQHNELQPRVIQTFQRKGIHVVHVSAGDEHVVSLDSSGFVYTWGKGYCGALGHGDEIDKTIPKQLNSLNNHLAVQVCARKRKTFVLVDNGSVYGFGWMGFGSLGFPDRGASDKILRPRVLDCLRSHHVSQISTGLYHTVVVTNQGRLFGFGDNERAQLGHDTLRGCLRPTEIFVQNMLDDSCLDMEN